MPADDPVEERLLLVGQVVKPHGLSGEVVVRLDTNRAERMARGSSLYGRRREPVGGATGSGSDPGRVLSVLSARPFGHCHLVMFEGVVDRVGAEAIRGLDLLAPPIEDPAADFVHELIGCEVLDSAGRRHGRVASVQANPASDLLVGEDGWLVPLRFLVAKEPGRLVVDVPEGLFE
ncbi:MAG: ribosome maturation factor RimM [Acidimicrobiales bacterium]